MATQVTTAAIGGPMFAAGVVAMASSAGFGGEYLYEFLKKKCCHGMAHDAAKERRFSNNIEGAERDKLVFNPEMRDTIV